VRAARGGLALAAGAGVVAVLAGCGSENVDTGKIERELRANIAQRAGVQPRKVTVDCPPDETAKTGRTFTCTLRYARTRRTVVIRLEPGDTYSATIQTKTAPK
jgi:hypothetical protein